MTEVFEKELMNCGVKLGILTSNVEHLDKRVTSIDERLRERDRILRDKKYWLVGIGIMLLPTILGNGLSDVLRAHFFHF